MTAVMPHWAARYNTWFPIILTPTGVVFSLLFFPYATDSDSDCINSSVSCCTCAMSAACVAAFDTALQAPHNSIAHIAVNTAVTSL